MEQWPGNRSLLNSNRPQSEADFDQLEYNGFQLEANWEPLEGIGTHLESYRTQFEAASRVIYLGG